MRYFLTENAVYRAFKKALRERIHIEGTFKENPLYNLYAVKLDDNNRKVIVPSNEQWEILSIYYRLTVGEIYNFRITRGAESASLFLFFREDLAIAASERGNYDLKGNKIVLKGGDELNFGGTSPTAMQIVVAYNKLNI